MNYYSSMASKRLRQTLLLIPALGLAALLVIDLMDVVRPSGVAAAACMPRLFAAKPDPTQIIDRYHATVVRQATQYDLPPELVAAVIANHQGPLSSFRVFTDCFGSALGANLSLGLAQMRLSTAALKDGRLLDNLSALEFRQLRSRLLDPELNIAYEAKELRSLVEQKKRSPGISAQALIHDPFAMALMITEYRMGRLETASDDSHLSADAFNALRLIATDMLDRFGRDADDARLVRDDIVAFLERE